MNELPLYTVLENLVLVAAGDIEVQALVLVHLRL
jgi:hypothetical protein